MIAFRALAPCRGYTTGPAFVWEGFPSVTQLNAERMPVVVVAKYLDPRMIGAMNLTRVRGIVVDRGSVIDPLWDHLTDLHRPTLIGTGGAHAAARKGDMVVIDGDAGLAIIRPTEPVFEHYEKLRGTRPPREPEHARDLLTSLTLKIRQTWLHARIPPPYDLPEQRRLYDIACRAAQGVAPTKEEDAFVAKLIYLQHGERGASPA